MTLLHIVRTTKLANLQSWHVNEIRQELEKTALSKKAISFILKVRPVSLLNNNRIRSHSPVLLLIRKI